MMAFSREWDRAVDGSPNRIDATVWGLTRLSKVITHIRLHEFHAQLARVAFSVAVRCGFPDKPKPRIGLSLHGP